jgi:hypothetical protein
VQGEKKERYACRILVRNSEGKKILQRPRHRQKDNIMMNLEELGWGGKNWIDLTQNRDQWKAIIDMVVSL